MPVYLDHGASAPLRPEAAAVWAEAASRTGNPSSTHSAGRAARAVLEEARERLAAAVQAHPTEVVFTAGGTESVNTAVKGLWWAGRPKGRDRVLTSAAEHPATLDAVAWLAAQGARVSVLPVDAVGRLDRTALAAAVDEAPRAVGVLSLLLASNEIGTVEDADAIADYAAELGLPLHWDAVAAFGRIPLSFRRSGATAMSLSAHKVGGPIGVGALLVRRGAEPESLVHGGGQQSARSGTMDAAGAIAFAVAGEAAVAELAEASPRLHSLGQRLADGIRSIPGARLTGPAAPEGRVPGHVHAVFEGLTGETLLFLLDEAGFAASVGSACRAGVNEPSHVLLALGLDASLARAGLRLTLGRGTTTEDVDAFLAVLPDAVARARLAG